MGGKNAKSDEKSSGKSGGKSSDKSSGKSSDKLQPFEIYQEEVKKILPSCELSKRLPDSNIEYCLGLFSNSNKDIFQCLKKKSITTSADALEAFLSNCMDCKLCVITHKKVPYELPLEEFFSECRKIFSKQVEVYLLTKATKPGKVIFTSFELRAGNQKYL